MKPESFSSPAESSAKPTLNHESNSEIPSQLLTRLAHAALTNSETEKTPADRFRIDPASYPIFSQQSELNEHWGDNRYHPWNIDKTLSKFVTSTAELIATIDGSSTEYDDHPELTPPDHIIYLDKSARPVSWLVNTFWSDFSDQERPPHSYLNIDRLTWLRYAGIKADANGYFTDHRGEYRRATPRDFEIENLQPDALARLRSLYLPDGITDENPTKILQTPSQLDGKNILIIDEVGNSGATIAIAKQVIAAAFPTTNINTKYFWKSGAKVSPNGEERQMLLAPVWYSEEHPHGRGIGNIDQAHYDKRYADYPNPINHAKSYGAFAISAPTDLTTEPDQSSRELMREIKQMRQDFNTGHILLRPPKNYDDDRVDVIVEAQGLRLAPASDPSPDTLLNVMNAIDSRPASI